MAVVVLGLIAPAVAWFFPYDLTLKLAIIALTGSFIFPSVNQIVTGVQQNLFKMHIAASGEVLGRLVLLSGLFFAIFQGWGLVPIVLFVSLGSLANFLFSFLATRPYAEFRWNWDPAFWLSTLKRSWPIGVSIAFNLLYYKADTLILSLVRPQTEVGLYGAAYRVLDILITVPFMYAGVVLPILSKHWAQREKEAFSNLLGRSVDVMMLMIAPLIAGTLLLGTRIMTAVAGKEFAVAGDVLRILILAVGVIYLNTVFSHAIVALNTQRKMLPIYITVAISTLIGYLIFIPRYGLWAAAWLTVFSETCVLLGTIVVTRRDVKPSLHLKPSLAALLAALIMSLVVYPLRHASLPLPVLVGIVAYALAVYAFGGVSKETLKEILAIKKGVPPEAPPI
jgi:O-antigen/teichoic acid export membrane protein